MVLMPSRFSTEALARRSARRPWVTLGLWVALLIVGGALAGRIGDVLTNDISFTNSPESQRAAERLEAIRGSEPLVEQVIVNSSGLTVDDPRFQEYVTTLVAGIRELTEAVKPGGIVNYYELNNAPGSSVLVSSDRRVLLIPVTLQGDLDASEERVAALDALLATQVDPNFEVLSAGPASINDTFAETAKNDLAAETRALPIALIVLVLVFGTVVAALLPMGLALVTIAVATGVTYLVGQAFTLSIFVTNMIVMIGLAVGIDYALFVVERFREERRRGVAIEEAIAVAGNTASRAVLFSGGTVVIGLAGMLVVPSSLFQSLALGAIMAVVFAVLATLTLIPALLRLLGDRVNRLGVPRLSRRGDVEDDRGFWAAGARLMMQRPVLSVILAGGLLLALTIPYSSIELGASGAGSLPQGATVAQAFTIMERDFAVGRLAPTDIVIEAPDITAPAVQDAVHRLSESLASDPAFDNPQVAQLSDSTLLLSVALQADAGSDAAVASIKRLRAEILPPALAGSGATALVGGIAAENVDFFALIDQYTPIVFTFVLSLSFILLLMVFRSIVVPAKAIVMNLLSVGAAYGLLVLVFQEGIGADLIGFQQVNEIEAWVPLFLFTILFGLSMDYHVFLLSRIRERYDETHDNTGAIVFGLRSTANIITGAAAIMVVVFGGFALGELVMFQQLGFGLATAVFLDATVVRTVLVPASMRLLGHWNWFLPSWLEWLPDLRVEAAAATSVPGAVPVAGGEH